MIKTLAAAAFVGLAALSLTSVSASAETYAHHRMEVIHHIRHHRMEEVRHIRHHRMAVIRHIRHHRMEVMRHRHHHHMY